MNLEDLSHISFSPTWAGETEIWILTYSTLPVPTEHEFSKYHQLHVGTESSKSCRDLAEYLLEPVIQSTHLITWNYLFTYYKKWKSGSLQTAATIQKVSTISNTGKSGYTHLHYTRFHISAILFQYDEENQYPIYSHGRSCCAGPMSCACSFTDLHHWYMQPFTGILPTPCI